MQSRAYGENDGEATGDRDMAGLSDRILAIVAFLAFRRRLALEAVSRPSPDIDLLVAIEARARAESARRRRPVQKGTGESRADVAARSAPNAATP
jgi:hypothetical protein